MTPAAASSKPGLQLQQKLRNWQLLQGRLTAAKWLSLSEPEVVREITELESEPLFRQLADGMKSSKPVLRRRRWPASGIHPGFYELKEWGLPAGESGDIQSLVADHKGLVSLIRRIGVRDFERYFLYGEDGLPLAEICAAVGISEDEGRRVMDLVLQVGARSEFFRPGRAAQAHGIRYHCIAAIEQDAREDEKGWRSGRGAAASRGPRRRA
jgi:hypothetical protein